MKLNGNSEIDGIIIDNHLGSLVYRVPATAARVQQALAELMYPEQTGGGTFKRFRDALEFYDRHIKSFAYDIKTLDARKERVEEIARMLGGVAITEATRAHARELLESS